ncbi:biotin-dependent carboxyltransferase family protein [Algibacter sp. Ld11]|uniref:5-oxoprolinase subunit C family protein n=1 Tax=Algibacter sp. Ld11 TaxID=649150 RepID=UPI00386B15E7
MVKVLEIGFYSSIQDFGRFGYQQYGVPVSGVMDRKAAAFANSLLGNNEDEAVLELTMLGPTLQFNVNTCIALSGANMSAKLNNTEIYNNSLIAVNSGDVLSFGKLKSGFRSYLAVWGGFNAETVMKSKSMYPNITKSSRLFKNDELTISASSFASQNKYSKIRYDESYLNSPILKVYKGPEFENLSNIEKNKLISTRFTISNNHSRMGYQLQESFYNNLAEIITGPVIPGTVQLTPSGKLIILMRDSQTTGGYPRVLQLSEASINNLAQKYTGKSILFKLMLQDII